METLEEAFDLLYVVYSMTVCMHESDYCCMCTPQPCIMKKSLVVIRHLHRFAKTYVTYQRRRSGRSTWKRSSQIAVCQMSSSSSSQAVLHSLNSIYVKKPKAPPRAPCLTKRTTSTHNFMSLGVGRESRSMSRTSKIRVSKVNLVLTDNRSP
jgi:hypothetical protein